MRVTTVQTRGPGRVAIVLLGVLLLVPSLGPCRETAIASQQDRFHPVFAPNGIIATQEQRATRVGLEVLRAGGNAVDAAVAIGFALAVAGGQEEYKAVSRMALDEILTLDDFSRSMAQLAIVEQRLKFGVDESTEKLARTIPDASCRSQALSSIGRIHARADRLSECRHSFAAALEAALEVEDFMGLGTPYSKGGAIRQVARRHGDCDLDGLASHLEKTKNLNFGETFEKIFEKNGLRL